MTEFLLVAAIVAGVLYAIHYFGDADDTFTDEEWQAW